MGSIPAGVELPLVMSGNTFNSTFPIPGPLHCIPHEIACVHWHFRLEVRSVAQWEILSEGASPEAGTRICVKAGEFHRDQRVFLLVAET